VRHYRSPKEFFETEKAKLQPGKCKKCGFKYGQHAIASPEEVEFLRSLGYGVFVCKDMEENPFLEGPYLEIVAMTLDEEFLESDEIEEMFKAREPDDPCDSDYMKDISS
jgi:hypothetical protein